MSWFGANSSGPLVACPLSVGKTDMPGLFGPNNTGWIIAFADMCQVQLAILVALLSELLIWMLMLCAVREIGRCCNCHGIVVALKGLGECGVQD